MTQPLNQFIDNQMKILTQHQRDTVNVPDAEIDTKCLHGNAGMFCSGWLLSSPSRFHRSIRRAPQWLGRRTDIVSFTTLSPVAGSLHIYASFHNHDLCYLLSRQPMISLDKCMPVILLPQTLPTPIAAYCLWHCDSTSLTSNRKPFLCPDHAFFKTGKQL